MKGSVIGIAIVVAIGIILGGIAGTALVNITGLTGILAEVVRLTVVIATVLLLRTRLRIPL